MTTSWRIQLNEVCSEILGTQLYDAFRAGGISNTKLLDLTIRSAFVYGCTDEQSDTLKRIARKLDTDGFF